MGGRERGARSDLVHFVRVVLSDGVLLDKGAGAGPALGDLCHRWALQMYPERQTRDTEAQAPINTNKESCPPPFLISFTALLIAEHGDKRFSRGETM